MGKQQTNQKNSGKQQLGNEVYRAFENCLNVSKSLENQLQAHSCITAQSGAHGKQTQDQALDSSLQRSTGFERGGRRLRQNRQPPGWVMEAWLHIVQRPSAESETYSFWAFKDIPVSPTGDHEIS